MRWRPLVGVAGLVGGLAIGDAGAADEPGPVPPATASYAAPPSSLELEAFAAVPIPEGHSGWVDVASFEDGAAVVFSEGFGAPALARYASDSGEVSAAVTIERSLIGVSAGPDHVIYGIGDADDPAQAVVIAIPLAGPRLGQVVLERPAGALSTFFALPPAPFANNAAGLVDLTAGGSLLTPHVDQTGAPLHVADLPAAPMVRDGDTIRDPVTGESWNVTAEREPGYVAPNLGREAPPARSETGVAVWATFLGAPTSTMGDPPPTLPVLAVLRPGEPTHWYRMPGGWSYAASDVWGTVFQRRTSEETIELARLDAAILTGT